MRAARGLDVTGGGVVCMMPAEDFSNKQAARVVFALMFEVISLIADRLRGGRRTAS